MPGSGKTFQRTMRFPLLALLFSSVKAGVLQAYRGVIKAHRPNGKKGDRSKSQCFTGLRKPGKVSHPLRHLILTRSAGYNEYAILDFHRLILPILLKSCPRRERRAARFSKIATSAP
jgi:hypothetical protein